MRYSHLDKKRWARIRPLLERALDLDPSERAAFLDALSGDDAELRHDLEALLSDEDGRGKKFDAKVAALSGERLFFALDAANLLPRKDRLQEHLGPYRLLKLLGIGGMGTVYLAERSDGRFSQRVALKVVENCGPRGLDRFEREREILARLRHPNIASLFDGGTTPQGTPYYTMEFVDGRNIADYCVDHAATVESRIALLMAVASALAHAHQNLVVHRDIKPSNILVTAEGLPKLLDFGIAKLIGDTKGTTATRAQDTPMTRAFAAPEQFRDAPVTVATDIFQFGTLCYLLLGGRLSYRTDPTDHLAWSRAVGEDEPMSLARAASTGGSGSTWRADTNFSKLRRRLSGDLDAILRKMLAKSPEQRYPSMDAVIVDLQAFLGGRPVRARRAGPTYFAWRWLARRPIASACATAALLAMIVTTAFALQQAQVARIEAAHAQHDAQRANDTSGFLVSLFEVADPGVNRGERLNANEILERGADRATAEFVDQPAQRARIQSVIGEVYGAMGDWPRARSQLEAAVAALSEDKNTDALDLARAEHALELARGAVGNGTGALSTVDDSGEGGAKTNVEGDPAFEAVERKTLDAREPGAAK